MTRLSVNVNKIALLRNARGGKVPDVLQVALDCIKFGAQGVTVHPRPDERHIRKSDVYEIAPAIDVEFNIEGYPSDGFLKMVEEVKPAQCTLVPDPPDVLTSSEGWDTITNKDLLTDVLTRLREAGVRSSLFIETDAKMIEGAKKVGADRVELYTGPYAELYPIDPGGAVKPFAEAGKVAAEVGLDLNAGHDLDTHNLAHLKAHLPNLLEVSIGHALVADALYWGLETTIKKYRECLM